MTKCTGLLKCIALVFLSSLSCSTTPTEPMLSSEWNDQQLYLEASGQMINQAIPTCQQIIDEELRGECVWFVVKTSTEANARAPQAERLRQAFQQCEQTPTEGWKSVCRFDVTDVVGATGDLADTACAQTGEFRERCMIHALLREEDQLAARFPKGKEVELMESIQARMEKIGLTELSEEPIHQTLTARIVARRFESAWRTNVNYVFSLKECGGLDAKICVDAYRIAIKQIGRGRLPTPCILPMTEDSVINQGLPVWSDDMDEHIQIAWKSLCHASYGPKKAPDFASSQKAKNQPHRTHQNPETSTQPNRPKTFE